MDTNNYSCSHIRTLINDIPVSQKNDSWKFVDSKGNVSLNDCEDNMCDPDDMISSLVFSPDGKYLAVGDYGGRVIIFKYRENTKTSNNNGQYKSLLGLTSHTTDFDKLRSVIVSPTIEHLLWLNHNCNSHTFISANSSTIKLWKIKEGFRRKRSKKPLRMSTIKTVDDLKFPNFKRKQDYSPTLLCQYPSLYGSPINSVSVSYDDQYFLVSDSTSIGMFNVERSDPRYELFRFDDPYEENNELISTMTFIPFNSSIFFYGTSHGNINVCDLRIKSYCDQSIYSYNNIFTSKNVYHSSYNEIHCIRVLNDTQMLTRDFMSLSHWDLRMARRPIEVLNVNHPIRYKLWELIENDSIFHRFQIATSPDAKYFVTGSYSNQFQLYEKNQSPSYVDTTRNVTNNKLKPSFGHMIDNHIYNTQSNYENQTNHLNSDIFSMDSGSFHDLDSYCPKRKLGLGCITEKSFDLLERRLNTFDFVPTLKRFNFEAGTKKDQQILNYVRDRHAYTDCDVLCDISDRKLNVTCSTSSTTNVVENDKNMCDNYFFPISFDPATEGPRIKPTARTKVSQVGWHPNKNMFVVATQFNLYFYEHLSRKSAIKNPTHDTN